MNSTQIRPIKRFSLHIPNYASVVPARPRTSSQTTTSLSSHHLATRASHLSRGVLLAAFPIRQLPLQDACASTSPWCIRTSACLLVPSSSISHLTTDISPLEMSSAANQDRCYANGITKFAAFPNRDFPGLSFM